MILSIHNHLLACIKRCCRVADEWRWWPFTRSFMLNIFIYSFRNCLWCVHYLMPYEICFLVVINSIHENVLNVCPLKWTTCNKESNKPIHYFDYHITLWVAFYLEMCISFYILLVDCRVFFFFFHCTDQSDFRW